MFVGMLAGRHPGVFGYEGKGRERREGAKGKGRERPGRDDDGEKKVGE